MGIRSRAQNFEDVMLWRAVGDVEAGFFIDVGAQHPIKDSVSKIFSEHGWRGIHVEPTPEFSDMLRTDRPNETVIAAVVSEKQGTVTFFNIADTGLSTGRRDIAEAHAAAGYPYREITVPTLSLDDLLALAPSDDIHWLKIDVEGMEREVLESWRTSLRRPWIVVIEANLPGSQTPSHESWEELILAKGYHHVYYDGLNRFYISDAHHALDDHFALPPNIFDGFQFDPLSDHAIIVQRLHQADIEALESTIEALKSRLAEMRSETDALSEQWRIEAERRIVDVRRTADAELADLRERERNRTEIRLAEIAARERDGAIAAAADKARLEQQIAALRAASEGDRAVASAREADLLGLLDELRAGAAAETRNRLEASAQEAGLRADLQARLDAAVQRQADLSAASERDLAAARDRIESLRNDMVRRERELLAQGEDAVKHVAAVEAARLETRLAEERIVLQASEERVAAALTQVRETQRALDRAREAAAVQERAIRDQMHDALERLRAEAERQRAESQLQLVEAHNRIVAAEHMAADRMLAHHAEILEQAEAFRGEIVRITDAATERERSAQLRIVELERREQETVAAAHAEKEALATQLSHCEGRMRAVINSRSWTLAKPLRWLLREQMIDQPSPEPALASVFPAVSLPVGRAKSQDVMNATFQPAQSVVDLLSLPASDLVHQSFQLLLGRAPSSSEQRARGRSLHLGCGRIAMIAEIHQSPEAMGYRREQRDSGSDAEFIERLYEHYLGRPADPDGFAHHMDRIQRKSRAAVEADVSASVEAIDNRSLAYEMERLATIYRRSRQWWRWLGRGRRNCRIRHVESEVSAVIARQVAHEQGHVFQAVESMRDQIIRHIETTRVTVRQDIARTKEEGQADIKSIIAQSHEVLERAANALREQGEHAFAALAAREADLRAELDQARIDTHNALALIREDAQGRFDRLVESQRAEQAAAAPSLHKVDARRVGPHARQILQRMRTAGGTGGHG